MLVWYAGYGSNLDPDRFALYLAGGRPSGAGRTTPGARDPSPPRDERALVVPGRMFFGWESPTWGGGISFLDADADDTAYARAYLLTAEQLSDVAAQEMHREPGPGLDLARVLAERRDTLGPGRYETLRLVGELDGHPVVTFTTHDPGGIAPNPPAPAYIGVVARGLRLTHGLSDHEIVEHLVSRPGASPWDRAGLARAVR